MQSGNEIYLLLIIFLLVFPFIYIYCKGNVGKPIFIMWASALMSIMCACYHGATNNFGITGKSVSLISVGFASCVVGSIVADVLDKGKKRVDGQIDGFDDKQFRYILFLIFFVVETLLIIVYTKRISGFSSGSISQISGAYSKAVNMEEESFPFWLRQMYRFGRIAAYYFVYVLINQMVHKIKNKWNIILGICLCLFIIQKVFTGSRSDIIYLLFAAITLYLVEYRKLYGNRKIPVKAVVSVVAGCAVVFVAFGLSKSIFGKTSQASVFDYLTYYMGGSIFSLDYRINNCNDSSYFMANTLRGVWRCLKSYFGANINIVNLPSTYINGVYNGNTYTTFYRYFADGGYVCVAFFSSLLSFFLTKMYNRICYEKSGGAARKREILYAYLSEVMFLVLYDEHFFSMKLSFGLVTDLIWLWCIDWFVNSKWSGIKIVTKKRRYGKESNSI